MRLAAMIAGIGNRILSFIAVILILLMFFYSGYSLWSAWMINRKAFLSDDLMRYKPSADTADDLTLDELAAVNPDVCGWLTVDDTNIDYPVVQGDTDMEYINKDVYGEFALSGSIFLSCLNRRDFSDCYNPVYGHHMANGAMFGDVANFTDAAYFESHQTGTLFLNDGAFDISLFACLETDAYDSLVYNVQGRSDNGELLDYLEKSAVQYRQPEVDANDCIIALSTCAEAETNGRIIVFGRLDK